MKYIFLLTLFCLSACNSVYLKPDTLEKDSVIYADRGGYNMKRSIKQKLENRGYTVLVGKASSINDFGEDDIQLDTSYVPENAKYIVKVKEKTERLAPIWCVFNGFWWWSFNVSIADQNTGEEIMSWRGRGCQNSSLRKLDDILDKLEIKKAE